MLASKRQYKDPIKTAPSPIGQKWSPIGSCTDTPLERIRFAQSRCRLPDNEAGSPKKNSCRTDGAEMLPKASLPQPPFLKKPVCSKPISASKGLGRGPNANSSAFSGPFFFQSGPLLITKGPTSGPNDSVQNRYRLLRD